MASEQVKKQVAKRKNYQNGPEKVRSKVGIFALANATKAASNRYPKNLPEIRLKAYVCKYMKIKM